MVVVSWLCDLMVNALPERPMVAVINPRLSFSLRINGGLRELRKRIRISSAYLPLPWLADSRLMLIQRYGGIGPLNARAAVNKALLKESPAGCDSAEGTTYLVFQTSDLVCGGVLIYVFARRTTSSGIPVKVSGLYIGMRFYREGTSCQADGCSQQTKAKFCSFHNEMVKMCFRYLPTRLSGFRLRLYVATIS